MIGWLLQRWHDWRYEGKITPVAELHRRDGSRPATPEEFERFCEEQGVLPDDGDQRRPKRYLLQRPPGGLDPDGIVWRVAQRLIG